MKRPVLTIALLSSGREETIERCLQSLMAVKQAISAEIIVTDTSQDTQSPVADVLARYADQVLSFAWCGDFARARNVSIDAARGEWYFFVDDDEWLLEPKPLIRFFKSGEYRRYDSADVIIRNYYDDDFIRYGDDWVSRLIRMKPGVRFEGRIHEHFSGSGGRNKAIPARIGHTGYIFHSEAEKRQHSERNKELLLSAIDEEPDNIQWWYHLLLEHDSLGETEAEKAVCDRALAILGDRNDGQATALRGFFICARLRCERLGEQWEKEAALFEQLVDGQEAGFGIVAGTYLMMEASQIYYRLGELDKSAEYCHRYLKRYRKYHKDKEGLRKEAVFFLSATFDRNIYGAVTSLISYLDARKGDWSSFDRYFRECDWSDGCPFDFRGIQNQFIQIMVDCEYDERFVLMTDAFQKGSIASDTFRQRVMQEQEKQSRGFINMLTAINATVEKQ